MTTETICVTSAMKMSLLYISVFHVDKKQMLNKYVKRQTHVFVFVFDIIILKLNT